VDEKLYMMFKRGQSAVEYLTTYGIILILLLAVIGVLFYFFFKQRPMTPSCKFPLDLYCFEFKLNSTGLTLDLGQSTGHPIIITGINCTQQANSAGIVNTSINVVINDGAHRILPQIPCFGIDGTPRYGALGNYYDGGLYIQYNESDTRMPHFLVGDIIVRYE
jgi:hypothetical protein